MRSRTIIAVWAFTGAFTVQGNPAVNCRGAQSAIFTVKSCWVNEGSVRDGLCRRMTEEMVRSNHARKVGAM